jgi:hypothetical protein
MQFTANIWRNNLSNYGSLHGANKLKYTRNYLHLHAQINRHDALYASCLL